jgi:predicted nucleic acid-binding protein
MFLLETDTSIHFMKGKPEAIADFAKHGAGTVFLSSISYHELLDPNHLSIVTPSGGAGRSGCE